MTRCSSILLALAAFSFASGCSSGAGPDIPDAFDGEDADAGTADDAADPGPADEAADPDPADDGDPGGDEYLPDGDSDLADGDAISDAADMAGDGDLLADGDQAQDGDDDECADSGAFDYTCDPEDPETCPGGFCILGMCIGAVLDPDRWADCGDGTCGRCEDASRCPADCGEPPQTSGEKEYDNETTMTVWVHGFYNKSPDEMESMVYGQEEGCGGILGDFAEFGISRPCGDTDEGRLSPDQLIEVEYYGGIPAAWLEQDDIDEIEQYPYDGLDALHRYALIVAKFIRHRLELSQATHVNLACHSMGCLISRYLIENDIEGLASENRFVRWFSSAGVIGGAQLARLYDNPTVRDAAGMLGLELNDFVIMHPDFVQDYTCVWDHKLHEGNNPLFAEMIIHHACACDPEIEEALNIALLDLNNPGDEPNDGIMYTADEYFHSQSPAASFTAPGGEILSATHTLVRVDHMNLPKTQAASLKATATLFHRRKVFITIEEIELIKDREHHEALDGEQGEPPAEIIAHSQVRYNPYVLDTFGKDILVHDDQLEYRTPEMISVAQGEVVQPGLKVFAGPVFDEMESLRLDMLLLEVDWYPRMDVREYIFDAHEGLFAFHDQLPLVDDVIEFENEYVRILLSVDVVELY